MHAAHKPYQLVLMPAAHKPYLLVLMPAAHKINGICAKKRLAIEFLPIAKGFLIRYSYRYYRLIIVLVHKLIQNY